MNCQEIFGRHCDYCFRPQQGLPIMNKDKGTLELSKNGFRPQQGLPIMNSNLKTSFLERQRLFPSPTGVTYYELVIKIYKKIKKEKSFRPQQGLPIMNPYLQNPDKYYLK